MRALATLLALLAPLAAASHDGIGRCGGTQTSLGIVEITGDREDQTVYVDDRDMVRGNGTWIYLETNRIWLSHGAPGAYADDLARHNVQRGGSSPFVPGDQENCTEPTNIVADLLVV